MHKKLFTWPKYDSRIIFLCNFGCIHWNISAILFNQVQKFSNTFDWKSINTANRVNNLEGSGCENCRAILSRTYLVNHDDEPVPVLTHRPELFVLLSIFWLSIWRCKCETRADCVSPMNTSFNAKYGKMRFTLARYFFWSFSLSISVGYSLSSIGVGSSSWRSNDSGKFPFWPSIVVRIRVRCCHSNSPWKKKTNICPRFEFSILAQKFILTVPGVFLGRNL